ncbi:MAG: hypothetical protein WBP58_17755 [Chitinophagaceae bacterium]
MVINIPCPSCGCQYCDAQTKAGEKVKIEICRCDDGSGEFEVTIQHHSTGQVAYEKHQCAKEDIAGCLTSRFNIDLDSMSHECFN